MDLPKILLTGLFFFLFFLVFLEFLGTKKNEKTNPEWTYPRFFSQDWFVFFLFFFGFPRVFGQLGLGQQKPREKPNKPKKTKKPILNGLTQDSSHRIVFFVFFCFFGFPRVFGQLGLGQQKPREKPNKPKKTKKPILNGLTQDSSHRIVFFLFFLFFLVFLEFLDSWAWDSKNLEKNQINQKKTILNGLTQDSSHRIGFFEIFGFLRVFGQLGLGTPKNLEKNHENQKTKKNNLE